MRLPLAFLTLLLTTRAHGASAGRVSFLEGEASRTAQRGLSQPLAEGSEVEPGDALETRAGARLEVLLADGSTLRLDEGTRVVVEEVVLVAPMSWRVRLSLALGTLWSKVTRRIGPDASFEVRTERVVAGVRGTQFLVEAAADHQVQVVEGAVEVGLFEKGQPAVLARHRVEAAHHLRVDARGRTDGPASCAPSELHAFFRWMRVRTTAEGRLGHEVRAMERPRARVRPEAEERGGPSEAGEDRLDTQERLRERRERVIERRDHRTR
jgi:ferric-dicitrate binding protein FerR (iron transport regulator)